jgi:hypothetical protein
MSCVLYYFRHEFLLATGLRASTLPPTTLIVFLLRRLVHPHPFFLLFGTTSSYDHLSACCVFLGYSPDHKGYWCIALTTHHLLIFYHIIFDETIFSFSNTSQPPLSPFLSWIFSMILTLWRPLVNHHLFFHMQVPLHCFIRWPQCPSWLLRSRTPSRLARRPVCYPINTCCPSFDNA